MEAVYKYYKPAWRSYYKLLMLMVLILVLACLGSFIGPFKSGSASFKWMWIAAIVVDVLIFFYIAVKRLTMSLILRDDPDKPENQEVAFIEYHPFKPFSSQFKKSVEIGFKSLQDIKIGQTMMQTLFGVGDIIITSSGTSAEEILAHNIPNPQAVRDEIQIHARNHKNS